MNHQETTAAFPPPWKLRGEGAMLFYRFPKAFCLEHGFIPAALQPDFQGLVGCVMLVDYQRTPVGPYRELLFIPGLFRTNRGRRFSITRIFVDSQPSMEWGRRNWGIPKELAQFDWQQAGPAARRIQVHAPLAGEPLQPMLDATLRGRGPRFPLSTALVPLRLCQQLDGQSFRFAPTAKGNGQWAQVQRLRVLSEAFPPIDRFRPFAALLVSGFEMKFPPAT